jgi:hypothetical protein
VKDVLAVVTAGLVLTGCGASGPVTPTGAGAPAEPAPTVPFAGAPPAAWIETPHGSTWLAYATFCWERGCADAVAPACGEPYVPDVRVEHGDRVRFHLGFDPQEATLQFFSGDVDGSEPAKVPLQPDEVLDWTVDREGPVWLSTLAGGGRDASYAACLRTSAPPLSVDEAIAHGSGRVVVRGTLYLDGGEARLCGALAESYPPQCPQDHLLLAGAEPPRTRLEVEGDVAWSEHPVTIAGTLEGRTLVVAP